MATLRLVLMVPSDLSSPMREIDRASPYKNLVLANDDTEDWSACDDAKLRRRVQNRLNQRAKSKQIHPPIRNSNPLPISHLIPR